MVKANPWLTILRKHVKNLWHDQQQLASLLPMRSRPSGQIFINNHLLVDAITVRTNIFSKGKILQKNVVKVSLISMNVNTFITQEISDDKLASKKFTTRMYELGKILIEVYVNTIFRLNLLRHSFLEAKTPRQHNCGRLEWIYKSDSSC